MKKATKKAMANRFTTWAGLNAHRDDNRAAFKLLRYFREWKQ